MVWLSGLVTYQQSEEIFERIGHQSIPSSSSWRQTQHHGQRMHAYQEHRQQHNHVERTSLPDASEDHEQQKGLNIDGGMMYILEEGWKEFKTGTVCDIEPHLEWDEHTQEMVEHAHAIHIGYTAVLGSVDDFAPAMWLLATDRDVPRAAKSSMTGDGADWIWNLTWDYFPESVHIIDWYHAAERLAKAAEALYPDDEHQAEKWLKQRRDDLYYGRIHLIIQDLDAAELSEHSHYFHVHQRRMQYHQFREELYPIGSGTVESGIKQFKARVTGAGMRWSRPGAQRMLTLRAAVLSHTFDELWKVA